MHLACMILSLDDQLLVTLGPHHVPAWALDDLVHRSPPWWQTRRALWRGLGEILEQPVRIYLTGPLSLERGETLVPERSFPGRQGRLAFAYLATERKTVTREDLAEAVWREKLPRAWQASLSAIVSKLRALLGQVELPGAEILAGGFGTCELRFPPEVWVDVEAADDAVDEAEGALRAGDLERAWAAGAVASAITRRPFLPGEDAPWVDGRQIGRAHV